MSRIRVAAAGLTLVLLGAACSSTVETTGGADPAKPAAGAATAASTMRARLQIALTTHIALIAEATGATFGGRPAAFAGARSALLGPNADAFAAVFTDAFGASTGIKVRALWVKHIQDVLDVAIGTQRADGSLRDGALASLLAYANEFGAAVAALAPEELSADFVTGLFNEHLVTVQGLIEAQSTRGPSEVLTEFQKSFTQAASIAASLAPPLAAALGIDGDPESRAAELRATLNANLGAHVSYVAMAADAFLDGRTAETDETLAVLLGRNGNAVAATFASYGRTVEKTVVGLWRTHVEQFGAYLDGVRRGNAAAAAAAQADLAEYATSFGVAVNATISEIPADAVAGLVTEHVATTTAIIDAIAANRFEGASAALVKAIAHMDGIATALADGIVTDQTK